MKSGSNHVFTILSMFVLCSMAMVLAAAAAVDEQSVKWHADATSGILNSKALSRCLPAWQIKQMTWPSDAERKASQVEAKREWTGKCMESLKKFCADEFLPADLEQHLVAMKQWGAVRKESEQPRRCDVFVVRFAKGGRVAHIQESAYNVVVTVANEQPVKDAARTDGKNAEKPDNRTLVIQAAKKVLRTELLPDVDKGFHQFPDKETPSGTLSKMTWCPPSVWAKDEKGGDAVRTDEAAKLGTHQIDAQTDGEFVRFEILKCVRGPSLSPDPFVERFLAD